MYWEIQVREREKVLKLRRNYREEVIVNALGLQVCPTGKGG